jgi:hypothetical protein
LIFRNMLNMPMFNLHSLCPSYSASSRQAQESCRGPTSARRVQAVARVGHTKPNEYRLRPLSDLSIACVSLLIQACIQMITVLAHRLTMRVNPQHTEMPALTPAHNPKLIVYNPIHTATQPTTRRAPCDPASERQHGSVSSGPSLQCAVRRTSRAHSRILVALAFTALHTQLYSCSSLY